MAGRHRFLVLASGSPARRRLLESAGIRPRVLVSGVGEETSAPSTPEAVSELAERKARAVTSRAEDDDLILGCDSLLDVEGMALGKPATPGDAVAMWHRYAGRSGTLYTGHFLLEPGTGRQAAGVAGTLVRFGLPTAVELAGYAGSGEALELAGAFSIDGRSAPFVDAIEGDPGNVVGLSLPLVRSMLGELGVALPDLWRPATRPVVRSLEASERSWLRRLLEDGWGLPVVSTSGVHDPGNLAGLVAELDGRRVGALTFRLDDGGLEVVTLDSVVEGLGAGTALLQAARRIAGEAERRLWLTTTDENLEAIGFYLRRGMSVVTVHHDFVSTVRRVKPDSAGYADALEFEYSSRGAATGAGGRSEWSGGGR